MSEPLPATGELGIDHEPSVGNCEELPTELVPVAGQLSGLSTGRCWASPLPADPRCASAARSRLRAMLSVIGLDKEVISDACVMASEAATNALVHGLGSRRHLNGRHLAAPSRLEIWVYPRLHPASELVVKVFDPWPRWNESTPATGDDELYAEGGRGIEIMDALPFRWGWHLTRSRLAATAVSGKATWFSIPLTPPGLQTRPHRLDIGQAAQALHKELATRGIPGLQLEHGYNRWLLSLACGLTIWSEDPGTFRWATHQGGHRTRPTTDLIDVAECAVRHHEELSTTMGAPSGTTSYPRPSRRTRLPPGGA